MKTNNTLIFAVTAGLIFAIALTFLLLKSCSIENKKAQKSEVEEMNKENVDKKTKKKEQPKKIQKKKEKSPQATPQSSPESSTKESSHTDPKDDNTYNEEVLLNDLKGDNEAGFGGNLEKNKEVWIRAIIKTKSTIKQSIETRFPEYGADGTFILTGNRVYVVKGFFLFREKDGKFKKKFFKCQVSENLSKQLCTSLPEFSSTPF
jgi:hypothetical protein